VGEIVDFSEDALAGYFERTEIAFPKRVFVGIEAVEGGNGGQDALLAHSPRDR